MRPSERLDERYIRNDRQTGLPFSHLNRTLCRPDCGQDSPAQTVIAGGSLPADATWILANSPYFVSAPLIVPAGKTLTLQPGTKVFFAHGASLAVNGQIRAEGTAQQPLRFGLRPSASGLWNGIRIDNSANDNRIVNAVFEQAGPAPVLDIRNSSARLEGLDFLTKQACLAFTNSSLVIRRCHPGVHVYFALPIR